MRILSGTKDLALLESAEDCEAFIDSSECSVTIYHGRVYRDGVTVAITIKAYQKLFADIYP